MESTLVYCGESIDGLFRQKVRVIQAKRGYRASEDSLILTWFVRPRPGEVILDVGTGCGVIAFGLAVKEPGAIVVGLEIQPGLTDRARRGIVLNRLQSRVSIVRGDFRNADFFFRPEAFDVVVCNPPYHAAGNGRVTIEEEKALAKHQLTMPSSDLFRVSRKLLKPSGRFSFVYPAERFGKKKKALQESGLNISRMIWIHPRRGAAAGLVCAEARPTSVSGQVEEDVLIIYDRPGVRSPEAEAILAGEDIGHKS